MLAPPHTPGVADSERAEPLFITSDRTGPGHGTEGSAPATPGAIGRCCTERGPWASTGGCPHVTTVGTAGMGCTPSVSAAKRSNAATAVMPSPTIATVITV